LARIGGKEGAHKENIFGLESRDGIGWFGRLLLSQPGLQPSLQLQQWIKPAGGASPILKFTVS